MTENLPSILLIEDDKDIRETMTEFLQMEGFSAIGCENGAVALDYLSARKSDLPKVIFVDLAMPVMDGPAFIAARASDPELMNLPCVIMSADGRLDSKCAALGIELVVKKPIELEHFLSVVRRFVPG